MPLKRPCRGDRGTAQVGGYLPLASRGFHRPLCDPLADFRLRFHGSEGDDWDVSTADTPSHTFLRNVPASDAAADRSTSALGMSSSFYVFVGDVIAGHGVTPLLQAARAAGCKTANGVQMVEAVREIMLDFMLGN